MQETKVSAIWLLIGLIIYFMYGRHHCELPYCVGKDEDGNPWSVGIQNPRSNDSNNYFGIIKMENAGLSTSGDYQRYFIKDGKRYCHILNPYTGYPLDNGVMSVTVIIDGSVSG